MKTNDIDFEKISNIIVCISFILLGIIMIVETITYIDLLEKQIEERDKIIKELTFKLE